MNQKKILMWSFKNTRILTGKIIYSTIINEKELHRYIWEIFIFTYSAYTYF